MLNYYKSTLIRNAQGGPLISVFLKISVCYCNFSFGLDFFFQLNDDTPSTKSIPKLRNTFSLLRYEGERYDFPRSCDVLTKKKDSRDSSNFKTGTDIQLFRERLSEKNVHSTMISRGNMGFDQYAVLGTVALESSIVAFL